MLAQEGISRAAASASFADIVREVGGSREAAEELFQAKYFEETRMQFRPVLSSHWQARASLLLFLSQRTDDVSLSFALFVSTLFCWLYCFELVSFTLSLLRPNQPK